MTKYVIFGLELIALLIWWIFLQTSLLQAIVGTIVIIIISQTLHQLLKAR